MKLNSQRKSSGQVIVLVVIVLVLIGGAVLVVVLPKTAERERRNSVRQRSGPAYRRPARYKLLQFTAQSPGAHELPSLGATGVYE